jgi:REP-associated tyrosine transposase
MYPRDLMARPVRIEYPGAVYHVMSRADPGKRLFRDDTDHERFLVTLGHACEKTGWRIHAYVLMSNHYHLLLETPEANLIAGMKWLQGTYTQRYNLRHGIFGHLLQGRYKAIIVDGKQESYFQVVSTYIHLNPARAGLIRIGQEPLKNYHWSSYPVYLLRPDQRHPWLRTEQVMASLNLRPEQVRGYEAYVESRVLELASPERRKELEERWRALRRGWYLGEQSFREKLQEFMDRALQGKKRESHSGGAKAAHDQATAQRALQQGLEAFGVTEDELKSWPPSAPEKVVLAWWLRGHSTVSLRWVSERLGMGHYSRVSQAASRMQRRPGRKLVRLQRALMHALEEVAA